MKKMGKDINAIFDTKAFSRIVMGVVTVAGRNCDLNKHIMAELLFECQEAMDNISAEEFIEAYHEYLMTGK